MKIHDMELYKRCEDEVSDEHPYRCVCGRLTTGLHEMRCAKFRQAVERRYNKRLKENQK